MKEEETSLHEYMSSYDYYDDYEATSSAYERHSQTVYEVINHGKLDN